MNTEKGQRGIKTKIGSLIGSFLSALGVGGSSVSTVCQTTCSVAPAVSPFFAVILSTTPLVFVGKYQVLIWWIALLFYFLLFVSFFLNNQGLKSDQAFLLINGGLLIIGFPYLRNEMPPNSFLWIGLIISLIGTYLLFYKKLSKKSSLSPPGAK